MPTGAYWRRRMEVLEQRRHDKTEGYLRMAEKQFRRAQADIEKEIAIWYERLSENNEISLTAAYRLLRKDELEEFHWTVEEYIKKGETLKYSDDWKAQLENASAKVHIKRLEALKLQIQQQCELLYGSLNESTDRMLRDIYKDQYYRTAFEIQKGTGVGYAFNRLDARRVQNAVDMAWARDGKNFSSRIWQDKERTVNSLNEVLTQSIIRGENPHKAIERLAQKMYTSKNNAGRLYMTESAAIASRGQQQCYRELGVEEFEFVCTLDSHTSEICRRMDGMHFPMTQYEIGVTAPPMHPYCRSVTVPYFPDDEAMGKRAARGEDGKTYYVPADMTYEEWQNAFVDDGDKSGLQEVSVTDKIGFMDITNEWTQSKGIKGSIVEKQEYTVDGTIYRVDGKHVILRPTNQEKEIAGILSGKYGKKVEFVPQVLYPQGIQTPDYLIDGERFDLKSPTGRSKDLLYNVVSKKRKQAPSFVFHVTDCPLSGDEIRKQVEALYFSRHTRFTDKIVIMKNGKIWKVYGRK